MKNYEAEKLKKIIKAKEEAMIVQVAETDELRKELTKLKSSLLYSEEDIKFVATRFAHQLRLRNCTTNHETCLFFDKFFNENKPWLLQTK
jgi:hypothetical protein